MAQMIAKNGPKNKTIQKNGNKYIKIQLRGFGLYVHTQHSSRSNFVEKYPFSSLTWEFSEIRNEY